MANIARIYAPILALLSTLVGCRPHIPSGLYGCDVDSDCPGTLVCSERSRTCISANERELEAPAFSSESGTGGSDTPSSDGPQSGAGGQSDTVAGRTSDPAGGAAQSTSGAGASGTQAGAGAGHSGMGVAGASVAGGSPGDACAMDRDGAARCTAGYARQACRRGQWTADDCPSGQVCSAAAGSVTCVAAASLCRGSEGKAVCGDKGELTVCNPDGTIDTKSSMTCKSTRHCQAGLATNTCAVCLANEEHHCEGGALQVCAQDGRSFQKVKDCPTAALCSESAGECLMGVCSPNKVTCEANTLLTCNAAGTAYASMADCGSGTCDATGGDCNQCDPGRKTCDATAKVVLTCNADGQASAMTRCPGTQRCAGAGLCVACLGDADCGAGNKCERNQCVCAPQCAGKECGSDGCTGNCGPCTGGTTCEANRCVCVPQCSGKQCGDDGCDGNCGPCDPGLACNANGRCVKLCGNGVIDPSESCDDANSVDTDACISCQRAFCGDGRVQIGVEECDPQATGWAGRCDSNCARTVYTPCRSGSDSDCASDALCSVLANTNQGICSPMCNNKDSDCVPLPDATPGQPAFIPLCNFGRCMPQCHSGACPLHMSCVPNTPIIDAPTGAMRMADVCITAPP